eukprot:scaffold2473_cov247-Pinguiococcus_pyrenoidosus.AAC.12
MSKSAGSTPVAASRCTVLPRRRLPAASDSSPLPSASTRQLAVTPAFQKDIRDHRGRTASERTGGAPTSEGRDRGSTPATLHLLRSAGPGRKLGRLLGSWVAK